MAVRPGLVGRVDGDGAHRCFVGDVPNRVVSHSGGDGNRTRVRKAPMYGFSLRLNQFTPVNNITLLPRQGVVKCFIEAPQWLM